MTRSKIILYFLIIAYLALLVVQVEANTMSQQPNSQHHPQISY